MERRAFGTQALEVRSEEERIIAGMVVPFNQATRVGGYTESFDRGAFDGADPDDVPLLVAHDHAGLPIGRTLSLTPGTHGLEGEWHIPPTPEGEGVMVRARAGVRLGLSVGFAPIEDRWSADRSSVVRMRAKLGEVSIVGMPAYEGAQVTSVRADELPASQLATTTPRITVARLIRR